MTARAIEFSVESVQAILAGRKRVTRRVAKRPRTLEPGQPRLRSPFGHPGDFLWVKETHCIVPLDKHVYYKADGIPHLWPWPGAKWIPPRFMPRWASRLTLAILTLTIEPLHDISPASAIAEGLIIQQGDGFGPGPGFKWVGPGYKDFKTGLYHVASEDPPNYCGCKIGQALKLDAAVCAYRAWWDLINRKRGYGWETNPEVYVIGSQLRHIGRSM